MSILLKRDDELVPAFCRALVKTDQKHVARMLGLYVYIVTKDYFFVRYINLHLVWPHPTSS